jgi:hypothetical protein
MIPLVGKSDYVLVCSLKVSEWYTHGVLSKQVSPASTTRAAGVDVAATRRAEPTARRHAVWGAWPAHRRHYEARLTYPQRSVGGLKIDCGAHLRNAVLTIGDHPPRATKPCSFSARLMVPPAVLGLPICVRQRASKHPHRRLHTLISGPCWHRRQARCDRVRVGFVAAARAYAHLVMRWAISFRRSFIWCNWRELTWVRRRFSHSEIKGVL